LTLLIQKDVNPLLRYRYHKKIIRILLGDYDLVMFERKAGFRAEIKTKAKAS